MPRHKPRQGPRNPRARTRAKALSHGGNRHCRTSKAKNRSSKTQRDGFFTFLSGVTLSLSSLALAPVLDYSYNMLSPALSPSYKIIADNGDLLFELGRLDALALDRAYSRGVLYSYSFSRESLSATLLLTPHDKDNVITAESVWGEGFEHNRIPSPRSLAASGG